MAEQIESFDYVQVYGPGKNGASSWRYNWAEWDDGAIWRCRPGRDFPPELDADQFSKRVHMWALRHQRKARTQQGEDERGEYLNIRFLTLAEHAAL
jgi:hypothetical protein